MDRLLGRSVVAPVTAPQPRALVVVDLFEEGQTVAALLRTFGWEATLCVGGEQALATLQGACPDLLYLDCWETRMNGVSLLQVASHYHPDLPARVVARAPGGPASGIGTQLVGQGVRAVLITVTADSLALGIAQATERVVPPARVAAARRPTARNGSELALPAGTIIAGRYQIVRWLGRGGYSTVYAVQDADRGELVALKWADAQTNAAARDQTFVKLREEYLIGAMVDDENVVHTEAMGEAEDRPYLVLELLLGQALDQHLAEYGSPPPALCLPLLQSAASAVAAVHAAGIVHRDLKPGNFFLDEGVGRLRLIDFGIALGPDRPTDGFDPGRLVLGTPAYVSPEQLRAETQGNEASDVFSLGVVFYELLTGRRPFRGQTIPQLLERITTAPPLAPRKLNPAVPGALSDLVLSMLGKRPEQRPGNGLAVRATLTSEAMIAAFGASAAAEDEEGEGA